MFIGLAVALEVDGAGLIALFQFFLADFVRLHSGG
jgi:hypothetical protein